MSWLVQLFKEKHKIFFFLPSNFTASKAPPSLSVSQHLFRMKTSFTSLDFLTWLQPLIPPNQSNTDDATITPFSTARRPGSTTALLAFIDSAPFLTNFTPNANREKRDIEKLMKK
ncbi:unnamed protein product [Vicia faba]|uniref:Uncharacterized protein n=1 Tax=Vicia faba TaxID=3906 RepID=A0AAV1BBJ2_VICFA|nr:unnamed protein product [Vicia faba]